LANTSTF